MRIARDNSKRAGLLALLAALALLASASPAAAAGPHWRVDSLSSSTVATADNPATLDHPGTPEVENVENRIEYLVTFTNDGDAAMDGSEIKVMAELPGGLVARSAHSSINAAGVYQCFDAFDGGASEAPVDGAQSVICGAGENTFPVPNNDATFGYQKLTVLAEASPSATGTLTPRFSVTGGGAPDAEWFDPVRVSPTPAPFDFEALDIDFSAAAAGDPLTQAGGHPYDSTTTVQINTWPSPRPLEGPVRPVEPVREIVGELPPGLVGNATIVPACSAAELAAVSGANSITRCPSATQVGTVLLHYNLLSSSSVVPARNAISDGPLPLFNMEPPPGVAARFGFKARGLVVALDARLRQGGEHNLLVSSTGISPALPLAGIDTRFWGVPGAADHERERACPGSFLPPAGGPFCAVPTAEEAFLRMPTACTTEGLQTTVRMDSWLDPGDLKQASVKTHEAPGYPHPPSEWGEEVGIEGCEKLQVKANLSARPTALDTETSSGLDVRLEIPDSNPGPELASEISPSDIKQVKVSLPQGVTINPSQAEGLGVCSPAQYESTELSFSSTDKGCPDDSKIGTVSVKTQLLEETIPGNVYIAKPYENPFDSLLAIYIVLAEPMRGVLVKLPGEVRTNEQTGRIEAEFKDLPQVPFSSFDFKFGEGARAPLITPPTCGSYETVTEITGWSDPENPITSKSSFEITRGIGGAPCPSGGVPGFKPGFSAGSIDNNAASYSPFVMRITRNDGEQDMTRFSAVLPPGVLGKLAGVGKCPNSAVAVAKSKSGLEERANPSCPANSEIGRSLVGAGVGSVLTYVPGKVYLGGAFNGRPLSVIAITPAVAGPFDVGTVVVQEALTLNPKTAEVEVDGSASDPIPHMLKGIPAKLRDLRVYVDRPEFIINPTSCDEEATDASLFGGGGNAFTTTDDVPVSLQDRFQAANCAALGFKPRLGLKLKGGTRRGGFPGLQATYRPRPGDANVEGLVVRLPRSAFLEQGHIRTICTRVQFAADACPKGAQYGYIRAWTPLLDEPLAGPVYLRSSNHKLPDLVFDLHGLVDIEVATRIDSIRGGVRATVNDLPDAPLSKVVLRMQGGKKGLIVNSRNLCRGKNRANVESDGQNGKISDFNPVMRPDCGKKRKRKGKRR